MGFFGKNIKNDTEELTDDQIKLKAAGVVFAIMILADHIVERLRKNIDHLKKINEEEESRVTFIVAFVTLFNAQKFFWQNVIKDDKVALKFEAELYRLFEKANGVNIKPYMKDFMDYIAGDPSKEVQYVGSRICQALNKEGAIAMFEINIEFSSWFAVKGTYEGLKGGWEMSESELEPILERIENIK